MVITARSASVQHEPVIRLSFAYDQDLVEVLKRILREARLNPSVTVGGWNPEERAWWVEEAAWAEVKHSLRVSGVQVLEEREPPSPVLDVPDLAPYQLFGLLPGADAEQVNARYRELIWGFHPDRLPSDIAPELRELALAKTRALNIARDELLNELRDTR